MRQSIKIDKKIEIKGKPLSRDLIFTKTRNDNLMNIKSLNLWGNDL